MLTIKTVSLIPITLLYHYHAQLLVELSLQPHCFYLYLIYLNIIVQLDLGEPISKVFHVFDAMDSFGTFEG